MIHVIIPQIPSGTGSGTNQGMGAEVGASYSLLDQAKRAANESLARLQEAPEPHTADNSAFTHLYDLHCRDREALFEALRRLEEALREWRKSGSGEKSVGSRLLSDPKD